jgi:hypothetical protein
MLREYNMKSNIVVGLAFLLGILFAYFALQLKLQLTSGYAFLIDVVLLAGGLSLLLGLCHYANSSEATRGTQPRKIQEIAKLAIKDGQIS